MEPDEIFWSDYKKKRISRSNPYYCCAGCGISDPQINGQIKNHSPGCPEVQLKLAEELLKHA